MELLVIPTLSIPSSNQSGARIRMIPEFIRSKGFTKKLSSKMGRVLAQ
jgi:hypothetical protein